MKTRTILITVLLLALTQAVQPQTAEQWITRGRTNLVATNLVAANLCFSNAVRLSSGQQTGNVFYAATRLLVWPSQPTGSNFLNRLGVTNAGRSIYHWTALPPTDTNGVPLAPAGVDASDFTAMLRTNILTQLIGAESNLANVTRTNFFLTLTSNETRSVAVTLDYGDVRLLRALLQAAEYACYTAHEWNLDAPLAPLYSLYTNDQLSVERLLADHPGLLTFATTNDLAAAKAALLAGVNRYNEASQFIRSRSTNVVRLFNYDPDKDAGEADFRQTLTDLTNSLTRAVTLTVGSNYTVFLGSQFTGTHPPRQFLPVICGNGFGLGTLPDPTFGGLIYSTLPGVVEDNVEEFLAKSLFFPYPLLRRESPAPGCNSNSPSIPSRTGATRLRFQPICTIGPPTTPSSAFRMAMRLRTRMRTIPRAAFIASWTAPKTCRRHRTTTLPTGFPSPAWALQSLATMPALQASRASRVLRGIAFGGAGRLRCPAWWPWGPSEVRHGNTRGFTRARV